MGSAQATDGNQSTNRDYWMGLARSLRLRANLGWAIEGFLPWLIGLSILFACTLLLGRRAQVDVLLLWGGYGMALLTALIAILYVGREKYFNHNDALVLLDEKLHLKNRLTCADQGILPWPGRVARQISISEFFKWNWLRVFGPIGFCLVLLIPANWIPISLLDLGDRHVVEKPPALSEIEEWLNTLEEEELVREQALEEMREKLRDIEERGPEEWYTHSALEASDHLKEQMEQSLRELSQEMEEANEVLKKAENLAGKMNKSQEKELSDRMREALDKMQSGKTPLNEKLSKDLKNFDPSKSNPLSQQQMQQLMEKMQQGGQTIDKMLGDQGTGMQEGDVAQLGKGDGQGKPGEGEGKDGPSQGGVQRGPGEAPLLMGKENRVETGDRKDLESRDLSRAGIGETLALTEGEHEVDKEKFSVKSDAGAASGKGKGGETVWNRPVTPEERRILQDYFK